MPKYLVRAEAVSFDDFIFGTNDISTIRGGGMLLRDALNASAILTDLGTVYVGGSTGLFEADWPEGAVENRCEAIRRELQSGQRAEAVFVVSACQWDGQDRTFPARHAEVAARSRWRQLQTPTMVVPKPGERPCEVDRLRPAVEPIDRKGAAMLTGQKKRMWVSSVTKTRREYGVEQKFGHYQEIYRKVYPGEKLQYAEFTNDFEQIADRPEAGRLDGKIALIHLDGNKFGEILRSCSNPEVLGHWAETLEGNWNGFLAWLLREPKQQDWLWSGKVISNAGVERMKFDAFRIETLLWGGDEVWLAVPAWKGWWVLEKFFKLYGTLGPNQATSFDPLDGRGVRQLSFGGSLIFAHYNAPIQRLRKLAEVLSGQAKEQYNKQNPRHTFVYQVLESFDHLGSAVEEARNRIVDHGALVLDGTDMANVRAAIGDLKKWIPRSRLHAAVKKIGGGEMEAFLEEYKETAERAELGLGDGEKHRLTKALQDLAACSAKALPGTPEETKKATSWLHLLEMWDYIPETAAGAGGIR
jgi:hypothetical protein